MSDKLLTALASEDSYGQRKVWEGLMTKKWLGLGEGTAPLPDRAGSRGREGGGRPDAGDRFREDRGPSAAETISDWRSMRAAPSRTEIRRQTTPLAVPASLLLAESTVQLILPMIGPLEVSSNQPLPSVRTQDPRGDALEASGATVEEEEAILAPALGLVERHIIPLMTRAIGVA